MVTKTEQRKTTAKLGKENKGFSPGFVGQAQFPSQHQPAFPPHSIQFLIVYLMAPGRGPCGQRFVT
jgi:hypothetical protein